MKINKIILIIALFFIFNVTIFASELSNLKYTQVISSKSQANPITAIVWVKNKNVRMESNVQGQSVINIIKGGTTMYIYYPLQRMAMVATIDKQAQDQLPAISDYMSYMQKFNPKKIGTELYDGKLCDVYEYTEPEQKAKIKVWLWQDKKFPVKTIVTTNNDMVTSEAKNIEINPMISDDIFELPPGTKIMDMQEMMKQGISTQEMSGE